LFGENNAEVPVPAYRQNCQPSVPAAAIGAASTSSGPLPESVNVPELGSVSKVCV
jgi:hypothetical protein